MNRDPVQPPLFDFPRDLPQGLLCQPDFVTPEEEEALLAAIAPLPLREAKFREYFAKRRVVHFHADADAPRYGDGGIDTFSSGPLPPFLEALRDKVARWIGVAPAAFVHALVSEYRPGTPIGWQWQHSMLPTKELRYSITLRTRYKGGTHYRVVGRLSSMIARCP